MCLGPVSGPFGTSPLRSGRDSKTSSLPRPLRGRVRGGDEKGVDTVRDLKQGTQKKEELKDRGDRDRDRGNTIHPEVHDDSEVSTRSNPDPSRGISDRGYRSPSQWSSFTWGLGEWRRGSDGRSHRGCRGGGVSSVDEGDTG